MVEGVGAAVVGTRSIVERVLDELIAGDADRLHEDMVGAASGRGDDAARAEAGIGRQPFLEQWHRGDIALRIDAAQLARAVIHVEIGLEIVIAGLGSDRIAVGPAVLEKVAVFALRRAGERGELFVEDWKRVVWGKSESV